MSNYIEFNDEIAFHPGYYIEEIVSESELSLDEFAKKIGVSPEILNGVINGDIDINNQIAMKLSEELGTSVELWLNLQQTYDEKIVEFHEMKNGIERD